MLKRFLICAAGTFAFFIGPALFVGQVWWASVIATLATALLAGFLGATIWQGQVDDKSGRSIAANRQRLASDLYDALLDLGPGLRPPRAGLTKDQALHFALVEFITPGFSLQQIKNSKWWGPRARDYVSGALNAHEEVLKALRLSTTITEHPYIDRLVAITASLNSAEFDPAEVQSFINETKALAAEAKAKAATAV